MDQNSVLNNQPQIYSTEPPKNNNVIYYVIFGVVILIFLAVGAVLLINKNKTNISNKDEINSATNQIISPSSYPKTFQGLLQLRPVGAGVVEVWADIGGVDVISYDVLVSFDKNQTELTKVESALSDFSVLNQDLSTGMVVTGFKSPSSVLNHNWQGVKILTLTFKSKTKTAIQIITEIGKRTSKFVDKQTKTYYPEGSRAEIQ